jgi:ubiquinone/menaquinone biosynthesis C-methylase UbiE
LRFYPRSPARELWGVDINANDISWCQQWLSPPLLFAVGSTSPHLPFADGYFDFVYCGSVFTHMTDLADAWLLEIKRVLSDGGHAYITIHDKHTVNVLMTEYRYRPDFRWLTGQLDSPDVLPVLATNYAYLAVGVEPLVQVFYDVDFLTRKWSQYGGKFLSVAEEAYSFQTALLWQKL